MEVTNPIPLEHIMALAVLLGGFTMSLVTGGNAAVLSAPMPGAPPPPPPIPGAPAAGELCADAVLVVVVLLKGPVVMLWRR